MAQLYSQENFVSLQRFRLFLLNVYDVYKDTNFLRFQLKAPILISR